jgi:glycosyltransferase involved in cell wall biosynthesis
VKVALVHECIMGFHGSERVLAALAEIYPDAPIFALIHRPGVTRGTALQGRVKRTSWLDHVPVLRNAHRLTLPFWPGAVERFDVRGFDVVISSHHAVAHGVLTRADQLHITYTHSPARYAWDLYHEHLSPRKWAPLKRHVLHRFRQWDYLAGQRPDVFIANSRHVAARISKVYRRPAEVVYPPVDIERFAASRERDSAYIVLGRLVPYKRVEVVVEAFNRMKRELVVIGDGPLRSRIGRLAGPTVKMCTNADDAEVAERLSRGRGLVFAGEEDFGIGLVEALASGVPVAAWARGGATEIVRDGENGVLFDASTVQGVIEAVERVQAGYARSQWDAGMIRRSAERFSKSAFVSAMGERVASALASRLQK